jgi:diguanylate cyclase (GGDEF)-like protein
VSATLGLLGVVIMLYPHLNIVAPARAIFWATIMVSLFGARFLNSIRQYKYLGAERQVMRQCNIETLLCALIGLGWGSALFVFDTKVMDPPFYLRFLILAAAMAFIVTSTAVFLRVSSAYTLTIGATVIIFILTNDYVQPRGSLLFIVTLYTIMISGLAISMNKQIRTAIANQLAVITLTEELKSSLLVERGLRKELSIRADTDELTGVFNRRGVLVHLNSELARSRRFHSPVAVLMIDIDHFKRVNDTYGHAAGDTTIRTISTVVQMQLRETDVLGRVGGEEFLVILPALELEGALAVAERIRESVEISKIDLPEQPIQITVSIGVGFWLHGDDADKLIARADSALYEAKHNGRNRIELSHRSV